MPKLDALILENVKQHPFEPDRLTPILEALIKCRTEKDLTVADRKASLATSLAQFRDKLVRLYEAIEDGIKALDQDLNDHVPTLKNEKSLPETAMDRLFANCQAQAQASPEKLVAFAALMREQLEGGDKLARKAYLQSVISRIEVDDQKVRIIGDKATLAQGIADTAAHAGKVRCFVRKWHAQRESNPCLHRERVMS